MRKIQSLFLLMLVALSSFNTHAQVVENRWRFNLSQGAGYFIDDPLKWGVQTNTGLHCFFHSNWGIGIKYSFHAASGTESTSWDWPNINTTWHSFAVLSRWRNPPEEGVSSRMATISTQLTSSIHYVATSLLAQFRIGDSRWKVSSVLSGGGVFNKTTKKTAIKNIQNETSGVFNGYNYNVRPGQPIGSYFGYQSLDNEGNITIRDHSNSDSSSSNFIFSGENSPVNRSGFGTSIEIGLEYSLNKYISLGVDCGYFHPFIKRDKISLTDISLGVKIYL